MTQTKHETNTLPEPALLLRTIPRPSRRSRAWERQNPGHTYRIPDELHDRIKAIKDQLTDGHFQTTVDLVAQSLIDHALEAYDAGDVEIYGRELRTARRTRPSTAHKAK